MRPWRPEKGGFSVPATVFLLGGDPGNGKSFASLILKTQNLVEAILHTDEIYTGYIFLHQNHLYKDNLRQDIAGHYIRNMESIRKPWHEHLFLVASRDASRFGRLLIEGWQLFDCMPSLTKHLEEQNHIVYPLWAVGKFYLPLEPPRFDLNGLTNYVKSKP